MKLLKGTLLIAGTTIGGAVLALPILTAQLGLFPTLILYVLCCFVMMVTGLVLLEVTLWYPDETNLLTLAKRTLGLGGEVITLLLYLFLFYSLMTAYIAGVGDLFGTFLPFQPFMLKTIALLVLFPILWGGASCVGRVNGWLMLLLFVTYLIFIVLGFPLIDFQHFERANWNKFLFALPITFTAFSYQGTLPSVIHYLDRDRSKVRKAIVIGTLIPLVVYIFWQVVVIGNVPFYGPQGLQEALEKGSPAIGPITHWIQWPLLESVGWLFGFAALVTSYLGVALGLSDFIADGFRGRGYTLSRFWILFLALIPPFIINLTYPGLFLKALDLAGGIGCALLLGLLPIIMAFRRKGPLSFSPYLLIPIALFLLFEVATEIFKLL